MTKWLCGLVVLAACMSGREDEGNDVLPKRGERMTDPTILSAIVQCEASTGTLLEVGIRVSASDPGGVSNLGTCTGTIAGIEGGATFGEGGCAAHVKRPCTVGQAFVVTVLVANKTGGFTEASVARTATAP